MIAREIYLKRAGWFAWTTSNWLAAAPASRRRAERPMLAAIIRERLLCSSAGGPGLGLRQKLFTQLCRQKPKRIWLAEYLPAGCEPCSSQDRFSVPGHKHDSKIGLEPG